MRWVMSSDWKRCIGYLGANLVIVLTQVPVNEHRVFTGWEVEFADIHLSDVFPSLDFAKSEGIELARRVLTQALVILSDQYDDDGNTVAY